MTESQQPQQPHPESVDDASESGFITLEDILKPYHLIENGGGLVSGHYDVEMSEVATIIFDMSNDGGPSLCADCGELHTGTGAVLMTQEGPVTLALSSRQALLLGAQLIVQTISSWPKVQDRIKSGQIMNELLREGTLYLVEQDFQNNEEMVQDFIRWAMKEDPDAGT